MKVYLTSSLNGKEVVKLAKTRTEGRSAVTGRFVTDRYVKQHPKTTEMERVKNPAPKKG